MSGALEKIDPAALTNNPFEAALRIPVTRTTNFKEFKRQDGEGLLLPKEYYMERQSSVRLYYAPGTRDAVYNLSSRAQRLYLYILYNLISNRSYFQINKEHYCITQKVGDRTLGRALEELTRYDFIAPTHYETVFYLNPAMFYPGNRLTHYPANITIVQER